LQAKWAKPYGFAHWEGKRRDVLREPTNPNSSGSPKAAFLLFIKNVYQPPIITPHSSGFKQAYLQNGMPYLQRLNTFLSAPSAAFVLFRAGQYH
jgi:hypothetical protein